MLTNNLKIALDLARSNSKICIFIGDSHARHFCCHNKGPVGHLIRVRPCEYLIWIGSKLMYSIATKGIDEEITKVLNSVAWLRKRLVLVWFLGEIDIRVYGVKYYLNKVDVLENVLRRYFQFLRDNFSRHIIVVAIPTVPSSFGGGDRDFPTNGSLDERCRVFNAMKGLMTRLASDYGIRLFDQNKLNTDLYLTQQVSIDGCHYMAEYYVKLLTAWRTEELIELSCET